MAYELNAEIRQEKNPRELRRQGRIPGVVYGPGVHQHVTFDQKELERLFGRITHSSLITLKVEDDEKYQTFIKEIQVNPITDQVLHVDFYQPPADRPVAMEVPVHLHGEAKGRRAGGIVEQILETVEIRGPIDRIPELIEVDVTDLDVAETIHAGELQLPEGVKLLTQADAVVVTILAPRKVEEVAAEEEVAVGAEAGVPAAEGGAAAPEGEAGGEESSGE
jgi:large subunit ribosomal protein L25